MPSPSYLVRNQYSYCFRINVPIDLQAQVGKKELRYSLKTGYLGQARSKARRLAGRVQLLFRELRRKNPGLMNLSDEQIQEFILKHLDRIKSEYDQPTAFDSDDPPPFDTDVEFHNYLELLKNAKSDLQLEIARGDHTRVKEDAKALMQELLQDGDTIDESSVPFLKLCEGLMRVEIKGIDYHKERLTGKYTDSLEKVLENALTGTPESSQPAVDHEMRPSNCTPAAASVGIPAEDQGKKISEVIPLFVEERRIRWEPKTEGEVIAALNLLIEVIGDM